MLRLLPLLPLISCLAACSAKSDAPRPARPAADADEPPAIRWTYTGQLQQTVRFELELAPEPGHLAVQLVADLELGPGPTPGQLAVDYTVTSVDGLELVGAFDPAHQGATLDQRREVLQGTTHRIVIDDHGTRQVGTDVIDDEEHDALGMGLHSVLQFMGLPHVPQSKPDYTFVVDGTTARYSGHDVTDRSETIEGVTLKLHQDDTWALEADLETGRPLRQELRSKASMQYEGNDDRHVGTATVTYAVGS